MPQRIEIVLHLQQIAAGRAVIERLPDFVLARTPGGTPENCAVHRHRFT
jgi:hypothetical protein